MENRARLEISSEFWMKRTITTTTEPKNEVWKASKRQQETQNNPISLTIRHDTNRYVDWVFRLTGYTLYIE